MKALPYLLTKEYKQMFRNWLLPVVFILLPIAMMNVVPRIATQEVKNLNIAVIDCDHSTLSSRLTQKLQASDFSISMLPVRIIRQHTICFRKAAWISSSLSKMNLSITCIVPVERMSW